MLLLTRAKEALDYRRRFRRFCGFADEEPTPTRTAYVRFRRELVATVRKRSAEFVDAGQISFGSNVPARSRGMPTSRSTCRSAPSCSMTRSAGFDARSSPGVSSACQAPLSASA
ncbi:transposase (plasmid) [Sphingobium sp. RSMS]|uniref:transposase n=1 Tax=Sphingobium sp. RSMS TaxID=520734 RepID=UPI0020A375A9|nr:transposase [Sphingobium sp. RSMS]UXC93823.1 transposase [Sphingobium sp. RSMS]